MVKPVDEVAFQILQAAGITLPIFILAVDVLSQDEENPGNTWVFISIIVLVLSALIATTSLTIGPRVESWVGVSDIENPLVNAATVLLGLGYAGLGMTFYGLMELEEIERKLTMVGAALSIAVLVFVLSIVL